MAMTSAPFLYRASSAGAGRRTLSTTSASLTASAATVAPAAVNSASGMPDFVPASGSTAISAPSAFIFLTVSGVAATRPSLASISRAMAMRIHQPPRGATTPVEPRSAARGERERDQRKDHHDDARHSRPAQKAVEGDDGRDHENGERNQPMPGNPAARQSEDDIGDVGAADHNPMHETVVHRHVRREIIALRR